jgi:hypothetical protein
LDLTPVKAQKRFDNGDEDDLVVCYEIMKAEEAGRSLSG